MSSAEPGTAPQLRTDRLLLRRWRPSDREPFAAINADPLVMRHFPATLTRAQSDALVERIEACFEEHGYGVWAVEIPDDAPLIGFVGLLPVPPHMPFAPAVEVGWRLGRDYWSRGIAYEAACASVDFAFERLALPCIVSFTTLANTRSRALMQRLGMTHDPREDFEHPQLAEGGPLRPHVLYRLTAQQWRARSGAAPAGP